MDRIKFIEELIAAKKYSIEFTVGGIERAKIEVQRYKKILYKDNFEVQLLTEALDHEKLKTKYKVK